MEATIEVCPFSQAQLKEPRLFKSMMLLSSLVGKRKPVESNINGMCTDGKTAAGSIQNMAMQAVQAA